MASKKLARRARRLSRTVTGHVVIERARLAAVASGRDAGEVFSRVGLTRQKLDYYRNPRAQPKASLVFALGDLLEVDLHWLAGDLPEQPVLWRTATAAGSLEDALRVRLETIAERTYRDVRSRNPEIPLAPLRRADPSKVLAFLEEAVRQRFEWEMVIQGLLGQHLTGAFFVSDLSESGTTPSAAEAARERKRRQRAIGEQLKALDRHGPTVIVPDFE